MVKITHVATLARVLQWRQLKKMSGTLHDKTTDFVTYEATPARHHVTIHHCKQKIAWVAMAL